MVTEKQIHDAKADAEQVAATLGAVMERVGIRDCFPLMRGDCTVDAKGVISLGRPSVEQARKITLALTALLDGLQAQP